jgi:hypothetical protein
VQGCWFVNLEQFALGEDGAELSVVQISAMKILLDRRLPSLRAMEVTGQADTNILLSAGRSRPASASAGAAVAL